MADLKVQIPPRVLPLLFVPLVLLSSLQITDAEARQLPAYKIHELAGADQTELPLTFGQVFFKGAVRPGTGVSLQIGSNPPSPVQIDWKTSYDDGSLRHGVLTTIVPDLRAGDALQAALVAGQETGTSDPAVSAAEVLASGYDVLVTVDIQGARYVASSRAFLAEDSSKKWLDGSLVSEWLVHGPLRTSTGAAHPHLAVRFHIRAYQGAAKIRTSVTVENVTSFVPAPRNYTYDVEVAVAGSSANFSRTGVRHYRQARWRKVFWSGVAPQADIEYVTAEFASTGAVPSYAPQLRVPGSELADMENAFASSSDLMQIGYMSSYMPAGGARPEIAPMPRWTARYLITQDARAERVMLGYSELAGSWPMHYRDSKTDLPVSLDDYPDLTVLGTDPIFAPCGGDCSSPNEPDMAHQPSMSFVPYLISGDYFHLEELQFWANWNLFYGPVDLHGGASGLLGWAQIRGQAWGLRALGEAAWSTPDGHPLKNYFETRLANNIAWYEQTWLDWNPLGYIRNHPSQNLDQWIATWMDDFLTWSFGRLVALGYEAARPFATFKARFPVGRMTDPDMCWILASTYWPTILTPYPPTAASRPVQTWKEYRETVIWSWNNDSFTDLLNVSLNGRQQELIDAGCDPRRLAGILGLEHGEMVGYPWAPDGYPSNLQPALAAAVELRADNADAAWRIFEDRPYQPTEYDGGYSANPQWAIVPNSAASLPTGTDQVFDAPKQFRLLGSFPNPFNPATTIVFETPETGSINLTVYDSLGRVAKILLRETVKPAGYHSVRLDGTDLASGVYYYEITAGAAWSARNKVVLLK